jgi:DNA-binding MarR family transcriptional regulator
MNNEFQILKHIENSQKLSQREISRNTGLSLGNVNILLKHLIREGFVRVERLNPRSIRYILTSKGFREKTEAAYRYISVSYKRIIEFNTVIDNFLNTSIYNGCNEFLLLGEKDEICDLIIGRMIHLKLTYRYFKNIDDMDVVSKNPVPIILVWNPEINELLTARNIEHIFVLRNL